MLQFESEVADVYRAIQANLGGESDQFLSLPSANQYRRLYELTARYVAPGSPVLDWGCGRGHFSYYLLRRGFRVTAYSLEDPPKLFTFLDAAERRRLTFLRGSDPVLLPFPKGSFNAVFSVGVLEHVRELGGTEKGSLNELRRVLAPQGALVAYHFPNRLSYIEALARLLHGRKYRQVPESIKFHKHRFGRSEIASLTEACGFRLAEVGRYGFLPRNSFNRLPPRFRSNPRLASVVNLADRALESFLAPIVQNFYFVAVSKEA